MFTTLSKEAPRALTPGPWLTEDWPMSDYDSTLSKTCTTCGRDLPATTEFFHRSKTGKYGLVAECKGCRKGSSRSYYLLNQDRIKAAVHAYVAARPGLRRDRYLRERDYHISDPQAIEAVRERGRRYHQQHADQKNQYARSWRQAHPERVSAHSALNYAKRLGKVVAAESCQMCGRSDLRLHAHHEDYSKPLDVVWLCNSCHGRRHNSERGK